MEIGRLDQRGSRLLENVDKGWAAIEEPFERGNRSVTHEPSLKHVYELNTVIR